MMGCQLVQFAESFSRESWVRGENPVYYGSGGKPGIVASIFDALLM